MKEKRILCFGDSNTWGYDAEGGGRFSSNIRWASGLRKHMGEEFEIIEEGLCGRTTVFSDPLGDGLRGIDYLLPCLKSHDPIYLLIIMLGTNDCKERFCATAKNIADGAKRLLEQAKAQGVWYDGPRILLIAPPPIGKECETSLMAGEMGICSDKSRSLAAFYEAAAKEVGCHFLDAGLHAHMNTVDFMHLDADAHRNLSLAVAEYIKTEMMG